MTVQYKVSLPGIKGFYRIYEVKANTSLYSFHKQMMADMDFPQDQIVLFKAVDSDGRPLARYSSIDLGDGTIDNVTMGQCHKAGQDSFVYFYDTTNKKSVLLDYIGVGTLSDNSFFPCLVDVKGPNPIDFENGYVAFEDRPKDEKKSSDDDWDDEDEDDDDEISDESDDDAEEIYDGNE